MKKSAQVFAFLALSFALGCDSMPGRPQEADRPIRPKNVKSFDVLWSINCAGCHGADGTMGAARPLNDPMYLAFASDSNMRLVIQQGVPRTLMPAFADGHGGALTDAQIDIVVDEMRHRWSKADKVRDVTFPPYAAQLGNAGRGAQVYQEFCSSCHGTDGTGGTAHGSIVDPAYLALVSNQALRSTVVAGRSDLGMPGFTTVAPGKTMSEQQIADVLAWLAGHRVEFPGQPYTDKEKKNG
ncbi:MAG: c-type cytochrome [Candidatus Binatia bacterium]|nr:c-type cytochrome [Candidatus Binatia bacterium]